MPNIFENCFGKNSDQQSIKDVLGGELGHRDNVVKQYKTSKQKRKKELKDIRKQNKMFYSISKKSGSRRELKNIKKIKDKASKNHSYSIRDSSINKPYSGSSLYRGSDLDEDRQPTERREMNRLDDVVTDNNTSSML